VDYQKIARELMRNPGLSAAAESREGQSLSRKLDSAALENTVRSGDADAMKNVLGQVLSTPEGKALAERVRKAIGEK